MKPSGTFSLVAAIAAVALAASAAPFQQPRPMNADREQVLEVVEEVFAHLAERDGERMKTLFWPGAMLVADRLDGNGERRQTFTPAVEWADGLARGSGPRIHEEMIDPEVRIDDNIASVWGRYTLKMGDYEADGVDAFHLVRRDGVWKIVSLVYTHEPK